MPSEHLNKIVLLIVSGVSHADILKHGEKMNLTQAQAEAMIAEAKTVITIAADYNRDEEVGTARIRLNDLYTRSLSVQDTKTALACLKELALLLHLYKPRPRTTSMDDVVPVADDLLKPWGKR